MFVRVLRNSKHLQQNTIVHWGTWLGCTISIGALAFILASAIPIFNYLIALTGTICFAPLAISLPGWLWLHDHCKSFFARPCSIPMYIATHLDSSGKLHKEESQNIELRRSASLSLIKANDTILRVLWKGKSAAKGAIRLPLVLDLPRPVFPRWWNIRSRQADHRSVRQRPHWLSILLR